ncbi:uncharacterized protein LOC120135395 [Hibiscus syriacus]|uniref:uncharacterized protein LOC120135395 n=1 Tax=Hibiscus syriacus TaxID=106335 RepID=UPI0019230D1F|nr:uncharacterized protein LOC120135395 [Hibiscus syriacus]
MNSCKNRGSELYKSCFDRVLQKPSPELAKFTGNLSITKMKKALMSLLSSLNRQRFRISAPLLSRNYSPSTLSSSSPLHSTGTRMIQSPAKIHSSIFQPHRFQTNPLRKLGTLAENPIQSSSKPREKSDLVEVFESAKTTEEMIRVFTYMEGCFDKRELAIASLKIGRKLEREGEDPETICPFAEKAIDLLREHGEVSILVVMTYQLFGYFFHAVEKFHHHSIASFNKGIKLLEWIKKEGLTEDISAMHRALHTEEFVSDAEHSRYRNWVKVLKSWGVGSESIRADIIAVDKQIKWGRYDEAVYDLARIVKRTEEDSEDRALTSVLMGKALFRRGNIDDSNKWFEVACGILDKKARAFPIEVCTAYYEMTNLYDSINEPAAVPSLLRYKVYDLLTMIELRMELTRIYTDHIKGLKQESNEPPP